MKVLVVLLLLVNVYSVAKYGLVVHLATYWYLVKPFLPPFLAIIGMGILYEAGRAFFSRRVALNHQRAKGAK